MKKLKFRCGKGKCRMVVRLTKHPDQYVKTKKCKCGGALHDYSADRARNKARTCKCDGLSFPHHRGSDVWCEHHKSGPADSDYQMRYG